MADLYCSDCRRPTELVFDHASGYTLCAECGLVLEDYLSLHRWQFRGSDPIARFCSHLGMADQPVKAAQEAVKKSEELVIRRSPISIVAAVIYLITQLSDDKKLLTDISDATGLAERTIRKSYKDIHPFASTIVPSWYAKEEDIRKLRSP